MFCVVLEQFKLKTEGQTIKLLENLTGKLQTETKILADPGLA